MPLTYYKQMAVNRAKRIASLIEHDAPDVIIRADCHLLWEALVKAYGSDVFEKGSEMWGRIQETMDDRSN